MTADASLASCPVVLACAEDDLPVLAGVRAALERHGFAVTMLPGVDLDLRVLARHLETTTEGAVYVVCESEDLDPFQIRRIEGLFSANRAPRQSLLHVSLSDRTDAIVTAVCAKLGRPRPPVHRADTAPGTRGEPAPVAPEESAREMFRSLVERATLDETAPLAPPPGSTGDETPGGGTAGPHAAPASTRQLVAGDEAPSRPAGDSGVLGDPRKNGGADHVLGDPKARETSTPAARGDEGTPGGLGAHKMSAPAGGRGEEAPRRPMPDETAASTATRQEGARTHKSTAGTPQQRRPHRTMTGVRHRRSRALVAGVVLVAAAGFGAITIARRGTDGAPAPTRTQSRDEPRRGVEAPPAATPAAGHAAAYNISGQRKENDDAAATPGALEVSPPPGVSPAVGSRGDSAGGERLAGDPVPSSDPTMNRPTGDEFGATDEANAIESDPVAAGDTTRIEVDPWPALRDAALRDKDVRAYKDVVFVVPQRSDTTFRRAAALCARPYAGMTGWRLPSIRLLRRLRHTSRLPPATYWSRTRTSETGDELFVLDQAHKRVTRYLAVEPSARAVCVLDPARAAPEGADRNGRTP